MKKIIGETLNEDNTVKWSKSMAKELSRLSSVTELNVREEAKHTTTYNHLLRSKVAQYLLVKTLDQVKNEWEKMQGSA